MSKANQAVKRLRSRKNITGTYCFNCANMILYSHMRRRYKNMLKMFQVKNYRGFDDCLTFDFSSRDYSYNTWLVQSNLVNKAIIYGKNAVGKSNLGYALFDIIVHLTDKEISPLQNTANFKNYKHMDLPVAFKYVFQFDDDEVVYEYEKSGFNNLNKEKLIFNGEVVIDYDYFNGELQFISENLQGTLNIELLDNKLSVLKYIYRNRPSDTIPLLTKMMNFCENMLWYRSLSEGNTYSGFMNGRSALTERLYESGKVKEFERFLKELDIDYSLRFELSNGIHELYVYFNDGKEKVPFLMIASTGTMALLLFFVWEITAFNKISFLFIDEFDAFLHYEASEFLVKALNKMKSFQSVLTTHNTNLMNNKITRPDCCYIMTKTGIRSLVKCTDRELREGHNLEKLYKSGEFYD